MNMSAPIEPQAEEFSLKENFSRHKINLFVAHRLYVLLFLLSAVVDAASTNFFMSQVGPDVESNFYVRNLSHAYGFVVGPLLGKIYQLFALWGFSILTPRFARELCVFVIAINFSAALVNFVGFVGK